MNAPPKMDEEIERLARELNYPGVEKLRRAVSVSLLSQGQRVNNKEVKARVEAFVKKNRAPSRCFRLDCPGSMAT